MGKRTFWLSVATGAVIGGLTSLMNREVREYVKESSNKIGDSTSYYINHPNEAIDNLKQTLVLVERTVGENSQSAQNALNQIGNTVNKFIE